MAHGQGSQGNTYTHAHTHAHTRAHTCTHTQTHVHTHKHTHAHTHTHTNAHTRTHAQTHTRTQTHTHTHTHTHTIYLFTLFSHITTLLPFIQSSVTSINSLHFSIIFKHYRIYLKAVLKQVRKWFTSSLIYSFPVHLCNIQTLWNIFNGNL